VEHDLEVDARGLLCPLPVLRLARALRSAPPGAVALLLATDPAAAEDVAIFCREGGHELLSEEREGEVLRFRVVKTASAG
jgi:tRNA 2-thiouridine synthesizing protein A